jgi:hypothetical protein
MRLQELLSGSDHMRDGIIEMQDESSPRIFGCFGRTNSVGLSNDLRADIVRVKMMPIEKQLNERKPEWGPENDQYSVRTAYCLPHSSWRRLCFWDPDPVVVYVEIEPELVAS